MLLGTKRTSNAIARPFARCFYAGIACEDLVTCTVKEDDAPRGTALLGAAQNGHGEAMQM